MELQQTWAPIFNFSAAGAFKFLSCWVFCPSSVARNSTTGEFSFVISLSLIWSTSLFVLYKTVGRIWSSTEALLLDSSVYALAFASSLSLDCTDSSPRLNSWRMLRKFVSFCRKTWSRIITFFSVKILFQISDSKQNLLFLSFNPTGGNWKKSPQHINWSPPNGASLPRIRLPILDSLSNRSLDRMLISSMTSISAFFQFLLASRLRFTYNEKRT